jgi:hypothetical protein
MLFLAGCSAPPPAEPRECAPFEPTTRDALSIEAAREAHAWAAFRRRMELEDARSPGYVVALTAERLPREGATAENVCFADLWIGGRLLFEHSFSRADGLGNELSPVGLASPFRRVQEGRFGGPETNGCRSCHWRGGPAGAGDLGDAAMLLGDGDRVSSADPRNPPALHGAGVIEALARQLTADLAAIREGAIGEARSAGRDVERPLVVQGVGYGIVRATPDGRAEAVPEGIDADLVVRPFGWKGTFATLREIVSVALHVHVGIQTDALVREGDPAVVGGGPPDDPDRDGRVSELHDGQLDAMVAHLAAQAIPIVRPHERIDDLEAAAAGLRPPTSTVFQGDWTRGRALFEEIGCASCHVPSLVLRDPHLPIGAAGTFRLDLSAQAERPRIELDAASGGYPVFLFSDLRRHDLGDENASRHEDRGVPRSVFLTRPLWGLADSAPYGHDGSSPTLDGAIARHGGEAAAARDAFAGLPHADRGALRIYLMSLRRAWRPHVP